MVLDRQRQHYFTQFTISKGLFYFIAAAYVIAVAIVVTIEPWITIPCTTSSLNTHIQYDNPSYNPCPTTSTYRPLILLFLTPQECSYGRRLASAVILGGTIGWERRQADRPAGIRTMSLVSLGSCLFTITSTFAFLSGPMTWDSSRVAAAIPSGVGFLGAGLIFKQAEPDAEGGNKVPTVHGLTTAASLWLSAAVGIACGGEMYFVATFSTAMMLLLLRFGPRVRLYQDEEEENDGAQSDGVGPLGKSYGGAGVHGDPELQGLVSRSGSGRLNRRNSKPQLL